MKIGLFYIALFSVALCVRTSVDPYHVLGLEEGVSEDQVRVKYRALKKSVKNDRIKQQLYDDAYKQIMIESTLQMTLTKQQQKANQQQKNNRRRRRRRGMPRLSDMFRSDYIVPKSNTQKDFEREDDKNYAQQTLTQTQTERGYQLPPGYVPQFEEQQKKAQSTIREEKIAFNKKAAGYIIFLLGILLKMSPCLCLFLIWKYSRRAQREQNEENNPFIKAMNGWSGKNRRTVHKKNK